MSDSFITAITNEAMTRICYTGGWILKPYKFYISENDIFSNFSGNIFDSQGKVTEEALNYLKARTTQDCQEDYDTRKVWYDEKFSSITQASDTALVHHVTIPGDTKIDGSSKPIKTIYFMYKDSNDIEFLYAIARCNTNTVFEEGVTQSFFFTFTVTNEDSKDLTTFKLEYSCAHEITDHNNSFDDSIHSFLVARDGSRKIVGVLSYQDEISSASFTEGHQLVSKAYVDLVATGTSEDINATICPPGALMWWPGTVIPDGWAIRDGHEISIESNPKLYALLGTRYNNGNETEGYFRLMDDRGLYIRGSETAGNNSTSVNNSNLLNGISFAQIQQCAIPNLKGSFSGHNGSDGSLFQHGKTGYWHGNRNNNDQKRNISFDANRYNPIYQNVSEVRTINRNYIPIIRLG